MNQQGDRLVSIVVPAYNAEKTIDRTLQSLRGQSYGDLEILVVDDGSTDATAAIVARHAEQDSRVSLLRQPNGGVARARNAGLAATRGNLVAMVDADDLWAEDAVARLRDALLSGGSDTGLAYCGYCLIDPDDHILTQARARHAGEVLHLLFCANIVGNGSCALFRREALEAVGGYDPTLRDNDAQGCEDHLIYFQVARNWKFACVPEPLVGYRVSPGAMSLNPYRMYRSFLMCQDIFDAACPGQENILVSARYAFARWICGRCVAFGPLGGLPSFLKIALHGSRPELLKELAKAVLRRLRSQLARLRPRFSIAERT